MKPRSITTGAGDKGKTRLFSGEEVEKNSLRMEALGDLDELTSVLGIARCHAGRQHSRDTVYFLQQSLLVVLSELATTNPDSAGLPKRVDAKILQELEDKRTALEREIDAVDGFIVPGANPAEAHLDHARAVARRCERKVVSLAQAGLIHNDHMLIWMNRLSDVLWLLARIEEGRLGKQPS